MINTARLQLGKLWVQIPNNDEASKIYERNEMTNFYIPDDEIKTLKELLKTHNLTCKFANRENCGEIGGRLSYVFTPTELGVLYYAECACGAKLEIQNMDNFG